MLLYKLWSLKSLNISKFSNRVRTLLSSSLVGALGRPWDQAASGYWDVSLGTFQVCHPCQLINLRSRNLLLSWSWTGLQAHKFFSLGFSLLALFPLYLRKLAVTKSWNPNNRLNELDWAENLPSIAPPAKNPQSLCHFSAQESSFATYDLQFLSSATTVMSVRLPPVAGASFYSAIFWSDQISIQMKNLFK